MKYYILIDPFSFKPMRFTTFVDNDFLVTRRTEINGETVIEENDAIYLEVDYDPELLNKTYDPQTGTLN